MKFFVAFTCLLAVACINAEDAVVLRNDAEVNVDSFKYAYEFDNSIKAEQQGSLSGEAWGVKGDYSYISPEGEPISLTYTADENGYRVNSANPALPTPPPIPDYILKSIEYINKNAKPEYQN